MNKIHKFTPTQPTVVPVSFSAKAAGDGFLVGGRVHGEFSDVLFGLEDDDVHLWGEQTQQSHERAQTNRHAQRCNLDLESEKYIAWCKTHVN